MEKLKIFFFKSKTKILILGQAMLLLCCLLVVSIGTYAIWSNDKESQTLVSDDTNPSEKYFTYYAAVKNIAAEHGYDYYPLASVPDELISSVEGLAVARYEGFEPTVQVPGYPLVTMKGVTYNADGAEELPVIHILYGYYNTADNLGANGIANNSAIKVVVIPKTVTYIYDGAFEKMTGLQRVTVKGSSTYRYELTCGYEAEGVKYFSSVITVYQNATLADVSKTDTLVLQESPKTGRKYYVSEEDFQQYEVDEENFQVVYESKTTRRYFSFADNTSDNKMKALEFGPYNISRLYIEKGAFTNDSGLDLDITYTSNVYTMGINRQLTFEWEDSAHSGNADYYTFSIKNGSTGTMILPENDLLFAPSDLRMASLGGNMDEYFEAYIIPAVDISNPTVYITRDYYQDSTKYSATDGGHSLSGKTLEAGKKYHLYYSKQYGTLTVTEVSYELQYQDTLGQTVKETLVIDGYTKNGYFYPYQSAYEDYIKVDDLVISNYPELKVYEIRKDLLEDSSPTSTLLTEFDLNYTNASYSQENETFELRFSPSHITTSSHYYTTTNANNDEVLNLVELETRLNVEKIYYLNEVSKVQNEQLIVTYENVNDYEAVFVVGFTPISTAQKTYAYYNGKEEASSVRYENCIMDNAEGVVQGLYDKYGVAIRYLYDKNGDKITKFYNMTGTQIYSLPLSLSSGTFSGIYDDAGNAYTELYSSNKPEDKITEMYYYYESGSTKELRKTTSKTFTCLSNRYYQYVFDLTYGSPAYVKFVPGAASDTTLPTYATQVANTTNKSVYNIYFEAATEGTHSITAGTTKYQLNLIAKDDTRYLYGRQLTTTQTSFYYDDDSSNIFTFANCNNMAYNGTGWENVHYLNSSESLWNQGDARFVAAMNATNFTASSTPNTVAAYELGLKVDSTTTVFTIPTNYLFVEYLRCDPDSTAAAFNCWNYSYVLDYTTTPAGSEYQVHTWGTPCLGDFVNVGTYLVFENYYEGTNAYIFMTEGTEKNYTKQFSKTSISMSKGTKVYASLFYGANYLSSDSGYRADTTSIGHDGSSYTISSDYVTYTQEGGKYYYTVTRNCTMDIYFKVNYTSSGITSYAFWFNVASDATSFINSTYQIDTAKIDTADSLIVTGTKGVTTTSKISGTNTSSVYIYDAESVDKDGNIEGKLVTLTTESGTPNYIAITLPQSLYNYNTGDIRFAVYVYNSSNSSSYKPFWSDLYLIKTESNQKIYLAYVNTSTNYDRFVLYGFERNASNSTTVFLYQSTEQNLYYNRTSYRGRNFTFTINTLTTPSMTYSSTTASTGIGDRNYYYINPSANFMYALENYINFFTIDISGNIDYYGSTYQFGSDKQDYGSFNSGTVTRNVPTTTYRLSDFEASSFYKEYGFLQVAMPSGIIDEAHTVYSFRVILTVTYKDGTTSTTTLVTETHTNNNARGNEMLSHFIRDQYITIECNMTNVTTNSVSTSNSTYSLSNYYGVYFKNDKINNFNYKAYLDSSVCNTSKVEGMTKIEASTATGRNIYFKSSKFFDTETLNAAFKIQKSYTMHRNEGNSSYEEYSCFETIENDANDYYYIVSKYSIDTYEAGQSFLYYGSSNHDDSLGLMQLSSGNQLILFTPNNNCYYDSKTYEIYNEAGTLVATLAFDENLTNYNGYQSFVGSIPVSQTTSAYFYIMSTGNNPAVVGRFFVTNDGSITYLTGYSAGVTTAQSSQYGNALASNDYVVEAAISDQLYAQAVEASETFTQLYPFYLVGDFNNWSLDNSYGLSYDEAGGYTEKYQKAYASGRGYLGYTDENYKYYKISNVYLSAGQSYRITNVDSYYQFSGFSSPIGDYDLSSGNQKTSNGELLYLGSTAKYADTAKYFRIEANGYTVNVLKSGYYDIVFEEYVLVNKGQGRGEYGRKSMYRTGACLNTDALYSIDIFFQNQPEWTEVYINGFNSELNSAPIAKSSMTRYTSAINGSSNWYYFTYEYRSNDVVPNYVYFEGTGGVTGVYKSNDVTFTITDDALQSGQLFFTPKISGDNMVVNVDNYYLFVDVRKLPNYSFNRYAVYLYNDADDYSWEMLEKDKDGIYYCQVEDQYKFARIVALNRQYSTVTLDKTSNALLYKTDAITLEKQKNYYVISDTYDSVNKSMDAISFTAAIFGDLSQLNLKSNEKVYAIFSNNTNTTAVEMTLTDQNLYYAINYDPVNYKTVQFMITGGGKDYTSEIRSVGNYNMYRLTRSSTTIAFTQDVYSNYESFLFNDGSPYLYYLRTSDNWSTDLAGLLYDMNTDKFVCEGVELEKGVGVKLYDLSGKAYMITTTQKEWTYDSKDLYSLVVGVTDKYSIIATASAGFVEAEIEQYTSEYLQSFAIATAVVYDASGNIVGTHNLSYTSNSDIYTANLVYLESGYTIYVFEKGQKQYTFSYTFSGTSSYYRLYVANRAVGQTKTYGWQDARNSSGATINSVIYLETLSYKIINFTPGAIYDGAYINLTSPIRTSVSGAGAIQYNQVDSLSEQIVEGNACPVQVYSQSSAYYARIDTCENNIVLAWTQDTATESKNSEYVSYITVSKKDTLVTVYNQDNAEVGSITIKFPGEYKLYYCALAIYASSTDVGRSSVTATRIQGEGDYTLWVGSRGYDSLTNTFNKVYEEFVLGDSLNISEEVDLTLNPFLVKDSFGNVVTRVSAVTLFDYEPIDPLTATQLVKKTNIYTYEHNKGYSALSSSQAIDSTGNTQYYSLTIKRVNKVASGVYELEYSTDNRRRTDDNYLVFTYVVLKKIPAIQVQMFYLQPLAYNSNTTYYKSSNVYSKYTGTTYRNGLWYLEVATEFDASKSYYTLDTVYGGYALNEVKIDTFEDGVTYYTFSAATSYQAGTTYYTYQYSKVTNLTQSSYQTSGLTYYIYQKASAYEEDTIYYKYENGQYVPVDYDVDTTYDLYTMEAATSYDPDVDAYYVFDSSHDVYNRQDDIPLASGLYEATGDPITKSSQINTTTKYYLYNTTTGEYTVASSFAINGYFTKNLLTKKSQITTGAIYCVDASGNSYDLETQFLVQPDTYYLGVKVSNSDEYIVRDKYFYFEGKTSHESTTLDLPTDTYYTLEPGTEGSVAQAGNVYIKNPNGSYSESDTNNGIPITDTSVTYYRRYSFNKSSDFYTLTANDKGYFKEPSMNATKYSVSDIKVGEDVYLSSQLNTQISSKSSPSNITCSKGDIIVTTNSRYKVFFYSSSNRFYIKSGWGNQYLNYAFSRYYDTTYYFYYYDPLVNYLDLWGDSVTSFNIAIVDESSDSKTINGALYMNLSNATNYYGSAFNSSYVGTTSEISRFDSYYVKIGGYENVTARISNNGNEKAEITYYFPYLESCNSVLFDSTYYYYKPETTYTSNLVVDSSADLVNGVYSEYGNTSSSILTISKKTGQRKVPLIDDNVYTVSSEISIGNSEDVSVNTGVKYCTNNPNYVIAIRTNSYYFTIINYNNSTLAVRARYYDPNQTYYTYSNDSNSFVETSTISVHIQSQTNTQVAGKLYVVNQVVNNSQFDESIVYYNVESCGHTYISDNGYYVRNTTYTNYYYGVSTCSFNSYYLTINEDVQFDETYNYATQYVVPNDDGSFSVQQPTVDYSQMYIKTAATTFNKTVYDADGYYTSTVAGELNQIDHTKQRIQFAKEYYALGSSSTNGYFDNAGNFYDPAFSGNTNAIANAYLFDSTGNLIDDPNLKPYTYYTFTEQSVYDTTGATSYYEFSSTSKVTAVSDLNLAYSYYPVSAFTSRTGFYVAGTRYLTYNASLDKYSLAANPINMTGLYKRVKVDKWVNNDQISYYYFETQSTKAALTPLVRFNLSTIFPNLNYYKFVPVTASTHDFNSSEEYYLRNTFRSKITSAPAGLSMEEYINILIKDDNCFTLNDKTYTYGSSFDGTIYKNDGYWITSNGNTFTKVDFEFDFVNNTYYLAPVAVTNTSFSASKTYYEITSNGLSVIQLTEEEFEATKNTETYYGLYNYYIAANEDMTLPSYETIQGYNPNGQTFYSWIDRIYSENGYMKYSDVKADHGSDNFREYNDNAVVNLDYSDALVLYPTFTKATYTLYVQIGSGYQLTTTSGLKLTNQQLTEENSTITFKVNINDGYHAGENYKVYITDVEGNEVYSSSSWTNNDTIYTYTANPLQTLYLYVDVDAYQYNVVLDANGGTINGKATDATLVTYGQVSNLGVPELDGASFLYWYIEESGTVLTDNAGNLLRRWSDTSDAVTLKAAWSNLFTVAISYQSVTGESLNANIVAQYNVGDTIRITVPTFTGYSFSSITGKTITDQGEVAMSKYSNTYTFSMPEDSVNVVIKYELTNYTVDYNLGGGTVSDNPETYTIKDTFTLVAPTKDGYTFEGWQGTNINGSRREVTVPVGSYGAREYTALWSLNTIDVNYVINIAGSTNTNVEKLSFLDGDYELLAPVKDQHQFMGWYLDPGYTTKVTTISYDEYQEEASITLYGKLEKIQYVYFDLNNVSSINIEGSSFNNFKTYFYGDTSKTNIDILTGLENNTILGYVYFYSSAGALKNWVEINQISGTIYSAKVPNNSYTNAILVFIDKTYRTSAEDTTGFNPNASNADSQWVYRMIQTSGMNIGRDSQDNITGGLYLISSNYTASTDANNSNMPYISVTGASSRTATIYMQYTGSSVFQDALLESNMSYTPGVDGLEIKYNDGNTETTVGSVEDVKHIGTYIIKITPSGASYYYLIVLNIAANEYDMTNVSFDDQIYLYDGTAKSAVITGNLPAGVTVTYYYRALGSDASNNSAVAPTNVGTYIVTAKFASSTPGYANIDDMEAYLIIYNSNSIYNASGSDVYFGVYIDERLTTILTKSSDYEYSVTNLKLTIGQKIEIRDNFGTKYLNWTNSNIMNNHPFEVIVDGPHALYFNVNTIQTSVTMPSTSLSSYCIKYTYNGKTSTVFLYEDSSFRPTADSPQEGQYFIDVELPSGSVVTGYDPHGDAVHIIENYGDFRLETSDVDNVTIEYDGTYRVYIKKYQGTTEMYYGFPEVPVYVLIPSTADVQEASVYYWSDANTSMTTWPGADLELLGDWAQIYTGYNVYLGYVNKEAEYLIFSYVDALGERHQTKTYNYNFDDFDNFFEVEYFGTSIENIIPGPWAAYYYTANQYTFDTREYNVEITDVYGTTSLESSTGKVTVTIVDALTSSIDGEYQYAVFTVTYKNKSTGDSVYSYRIRYSATGTEDQPILIGSQTDFNRYVGGAGFAAMNGLFLKQTADIEVKEKNTDSTLDYLNPYSNTNPFSNVYNGNGKTISFTQDVYHITSMQMTSSTQPYNGLFGYIGTNGIVKNLTLSYAVTTAHTEQGYIPAMYVGALASFNAGTIENVTTTTATINGNNSRYVGGLVGRNLEFATITGCTNNISFVFWNWGISDSYIIGGITGYNVGTITSCVNNGNIQVNSNSNRSNYAAGIAALSSGTIVGCSNTGTIKVTHGASASENPIIQAEISTNITKEIWMGVENDWFLTETTYDVSETVDDVTTTYTYRVEGKLLVEYLDSSGQVINKLEYGRGQLNYITIDATSSFSYMPIDIFQNTYSLRISRILVISSERDEGRYAYTSNAQFDQAQLLGGNAVITATTFTRITNTEYIGYPEATYTINVTNDQLYYMMNNQCAFYMWAQESTSIYDTGYDASGNVTPNADNRATWSNFNPDLTRDVTAQILVEGLQSILGVGTYYKVIYLNEDQDAIFMQAGQVTDGDNYISYYAGTSYLRFAEVVGIEGYNGIQYYLEQAALYYEGLAAAETDEEKKAEYTLQAAGLRAKANLYKAKDFDVIVPMSGKNYMMTLYLYEEPANPGHYNHSWGYDPSVTQTNPITFVDLIPISFQDLKLMYCTYLNEDGDIITTAQYAVPNTPTMQLYNFVGAKTIIMSAEFARGIYAQIEIAIPDDYYDTVNDTYHKKLYAFNRGYYWLEDYTGSHVERQIVNQYGNAMDDANNFGFMIEHHDADGNVFEIESYTTSAANMEKDKVYDGYIEYNVLTNFNWFEDTSYVVVRQMNISPTPGTVTIYSPTAAQVTYPLYIYSCGETHTGVDGSTVTPGLKYAYIPTIATTATLKVFNEVEWYANGDALMLVNYYDATYNIIGTKTYDVMTQQDIDIVSGTAYLEFCRLCPQAEFNYVSVTYTGNEDKYLLLSGDNVASWVEVGYLPVRSNVKLYNYISAWRNQTLTVDYYAGSDLIKTIEILGSQNTLPIYDGSTSFVISCGGYALNVESIDIDKNLYLTITNSGIMLALWSTAPVVLTTAYIPVVFDNTLTWWKSVKVSYYTQTGILITTLSYYTTTSYFAYINGASRMTITVNNETEEKFTILNITLDSTLYFGLDDGSNETFIWVSNNFKNVSSTALIEVNNTISWWKDSTALTKVYYYADDELITIWAGLSTQKFSIPLYEGTTSMKIVRLNSSALTESNAMTITNIYSSKILKLYSPSANVAAFTWVAKELKADEIQQFIYFDPGSLEDIVSVSISYITPEGTKGSLPMEYDRETEYYQILWDSLLAVRIDSICFVVEFDDYSSEYPYVSFDTIDIETKNIYLADEFRFNGLLIAKTALYLNTSRTAAWEEYYVNIYNGTTLVKSYPMTYMSEKACYATTVDTEYLVDPYRLTYSSNPNDAYVIETDKLVYEEAKPIYVIYGIGAVVGVMSNDASPVVTALYSGDTRIDESKASFYDVSQYVFANIGGWTAAIDSDTLDALYITSLNAAMTSAGTNSLITNDGSTLDDYSAILDSDGNLQYYAYSVGAMNGWSTHQALYGLSYIGMKDSHYIFYHYLVLSESAEHKIHLGTGWNRNFAEDNNTIEYEYSTNETYVESTFNGHANISSQAGKYFVIFEVTAASDSFTENEVTTEYNVSGIHVMSLRTKYTITWVTGEDSIVEYYYADDIPEYPGSEPTKMPTSKYSYTFNGWSPVLRPVSANATYEAQFTATLRSYEITYSYDTNEDTTETYAITNEYGYRIVDSYVVDANFSAIREGYEFGGWYFDEACTNRATGATVNANITVYAKWIASELAVNITTTAADLENVLSGEGITYTANVTANFGLENTTFTWYVDGNVQSQTTQSITLNISSLGTHTVYCVVATDYTSNDMHEEVTSSTISVTVVAAPDTDYSDDTQYDGLSFVTKPSPRIKKDQALGD